MLRFLWVVCLLVTFTGCNEAPIDSSGTAPGSPVVDISADELGTLLEQHRGKVVLINLWATWCAPCLREIPDLMALEEEHRSEGFALVGISMDTDQTNEAVAAFRDKWFPEFDTFRSVESDWDTLASVVDPAWDQILPTSFILDREGNLGDVVTGGKTHQEFVAAVKPFLSAE